MLLAMKVRMRMMQMMLGGEKMLIITNLVSCGKLHIYLVTLVTMMKFMILYGQVELLS